MKDFKKNDVERKIDEIFTRGVGEFIDPGNTFRERLLKKARGEYDKPIIIKYGIDPTRPDIHLGHVVCFRKLRQLQELGCKVVFLVGDFTARIGDPTGKSKVRPEIDQQDIERNVASYFECLNKIIITDDPVFSWIRNSDWFYTWSDIVPATNVTSINISIKQSGKEGELQENNFSVPADSFLGKSIFYLNTRMQVTHLHRKRLSEVSLRGLLWTLKHITVAQLEVRDMFLKRRENGDPLFMHEMLYPVLQGIDSFILADIYESCDLELGGTDQTFNMLMGREVMESNGSYPQSVLTLKILEGIDGREKMSKSLDNYISISDKPRDMFGNVMSIPDSSLLNYFELCTDVPMDEVHNIGKEMKNGNLNPRDAKLRLAKEIVTIYHGENLAEEAEAFFISTFSKGEAPSDVHETVLSESINILVLLVQERFAGSRADARRKVEQGGVEIDGKKITDREFMIEKSDTPQLLRSGKKDFVRIVFE